MDCVAITRGGYGDLWLMPSREEADLHPLIQYGDAIVAEPDDVSRQYTRLDLPYMMRRLGHDDLAESMHAEKCYHAFLEAAAEPPDDPSLILEQVRHDRANHRKEWQTMEKATAGTAPSKASPAPKEDKGPKKVAGYTEDQKITAFGKDKDGNAYNTTDNNPKRSGTKSEARFKLYKVGMTLREALDAGVYAGDIENDANKNKFIIIG